jgi:putative nucleotidyltransferase with HDIG domain
MILPITEKEQLVNRLLNRVIDFPPLPGFVSKIMELNADPESSLKDIGRVVEAEVSLAASVIKLVNSPFYGLSHDVPSIPHAISLLGRNELVNLVLANAMFQTCKDFREKKQHIAALRLHCFKCAIAARYLAEKMGLNGGDFFLAGLMHDLGKIIIYLGFPEETLAQIYRDSPLTHDDIGDEEEYLGVGHALLGASLLAFWRFPAPLQAAVKYHHQPDRAPEHAIYPLVIHTADILVRTLEARQGVGQDPLDLCQRLFAKTINQLLADAGIIIHAENLEELLEEMRTQLALEDDITNMFA